MRRVIAALALLPVGASVIAAGPAEGCQTITVETRDATTEQNVCEEATWFHRNGARINEYGEGGNSVPTWSTEEPTGSFQGGEGAMQLGFPASVVSGTAGEDHANSGAVFEGTYEGPIDVMDVTIHAFYSGYLSTGNPTERADFSVSTGLIIDGEPVLIPGAYLMEDVTTKETGTPGLYEIRFAVTGIAEFMQDYDMALDGQHDIHLEIAPNYVNTQPVSFFVYDTTEVPGGIVFNPLELSEDATIAKAS